MGKEEGCMKRLLLFMFMALMIYQVDGTAKVAWQEQGNPVGYEVCLRRMNVKNTEYHVYGTTTTTKTFNVPVPTTGQFEMLARAVFVVDGVTIYSDWCSSLDTSCSLLKNGSVGQWAIRRSY
jgi:hypothetical protein